MIDLFFQKKNVLHLPKNIFEVVNYVKSSILKFKPNLILSLHAGWGKRDGEIQLLLMKKIIKVLINTKQQK